MTVDFFKQRYGYEIEGMWMPRVTAVTSMVSKAGFFASTESADWGTLVHETVGRFLKKEISSVDAALSPLMKAFVAWGRANTLAVADTDKLIECKVFDKEHGYAGTADLIAQVQGRRGVIDIKTSTAMRDEYSLQTAAYLNAYNKNVSKEERCETRWILRLDQFAECRGCLAKKREKGKRTTVSGGNRACNHVWGGVRAEIEFEELTQHDHDLQAFLSAKELWEWYNRDWLRRIPNYPPKFLQKVLI